MSDDSRTMPTLESNQFAALDALTDLLMQKKEKIAAWFQQAWQQYPPPIYGSVDLRHAGYKIAPVDMNLFPAGFNNLHQEGLARERQAIKDTISSIQKNVRRILIIPESHTRNRYYWRNVCTIQKLLESAGFEVRVGSMAAEITAMEVIKLPYCETLHVYPLIEKNNILQVEGFIPDLIILNNDLADGVPEMLSMSTQVIVPSRKLGWQQRTKSSYFNFYHQVTKQFGQEFNIDPWLITPYHDAADDVDFVKQTGLNAVIEKAEKLFADIKQKYQHYRIQRAPFLIIKADSGTYGMGVMTVRDPEELKSLNRKQRTRMMASKGSQPIHRVLLQEGVPTVEQFEKHRAEPVIYLWGHTAIGGFYRIHESRGDDENLNAPGMYFKPMVLSEDTKDERLHAYVVIGLLSQLAAAFEMRQATS